MGYIGINGHHRVCYGGDVGVTKGGDMNGHDRG